MHCNLTTNLLHKKSCLKDFDHSRASASRHATYLLIECFRNGNVSEFDNVHEAIIQRSRSDFAAMSLLTANESRRRATPTAPPAPGRRVSSTIVFSRVCKSPITFLRLIPWRSLYKETAATRK